MNWLCHKGLSNWFFMIYTTLAMVGTFPFAAVESPRVIHFELQDQDWDTIGNPPRDYGIRYPAEEPALVIGRGGGFLPRGGLQRFVFLWALPDCGTNFFGPSLATVAEAQFFDVKNNILLKLRI
jgi:hypothetical protein